MRKCATLLSFVLFTFTSAVYADEDPSVTQGAKGYDWQSCVESKTNDCVNNCQNSDDINCANSCSDMAKDKCQSEGLNPPQDSNSVDSPQ